MMNSGKSFTLLSVLLLSLASVNAQAHDRGHNQPPTHGKHGVYQRHPHPGPVHRYGAPAVHGRLLLSPIVITVAAPRPAGIAYTRPTYAAGNAYSVQRNRWYQRDASGDCFEVALLRTGEQVWTQVAYGLCQ